MSSMQIEPEYITTMKKSRGGQPPIYEILLIKDPRLEYVHNGMSTGLPDMDISESAGFYYELESAVDALHSNALDIREGIYNAAFILCKFPGLYNSVGDYGRIFFEWDDKRGGFFEAEEPKLYNNIAL